MQVHILWHQRMVTDGINCVSYGILCIVETLQPMVQVDATETNGVDDILRDASF